MGRQAAVIDPKVEDSTRDLIGHAVRGELDELVGLMTELDPDCRIECLVLCLRIVGYIAIDICGHAWPTDADLHEIAREMSAADLNFKLEEADAYAFLRRAALGFEPIFDVFPEKDKAVAVPIFTSAALLASYRREPRHWWEYLDVIEQALEQAAPLPKETVPAVLLWSRISRAVETQRFGERTAGA
jgi:hypothetical protein